MDVTLPVYGYAESMFDYARQRARQVLEVSQKAILISKGPAGVQAGEFPCESRDLLLFVLVPKTSDHLFNLEHDNEVTLLSAGWEMKGKAQILPNEKYPCSLKLIEDPNALWCGLLKVEPSILQIRREKGWGNQETIDFNNR